MPFIKKFDVGSKLSFFVNSAQDSMEQVQGQTRVKPAPNESFSDRTVFDSQIHHTSKLTAPNMAPPSTSITVTSNVPHFDSSIIENACYSTEMRCQVPSTGDFMCSTNIPHPESLNPGQEIEVGVSAQLRYEDSMMEDEYDDVEEYRPQLVCEITFEFGEHTIPAQRLAKLFVEEASGAMLDLAEGDSDGEGKLPVEVESSSSISDEVRPEVPLAGDGVEELVIGDIEGVNEGLDVVEVNGSGEKIAEPVLGVYDTVERSGFGEGGSGLNLEAHVSDPEDKAGDDEVAELVKPVLEACDTVKRSESFEVGSDVDLEVPASGSEDVIDLVASSDEVRGAQFSANEDKSVVRTLSSSSSSSFPGEVRHEVSGECDERLASAGVDGANEGHNSIELESVSAEPVHTVAFVEPDILSHSSVNTGRQVPTKSQNETPDENDKSVTNPSTEGESVKPDPSHDSPNPPCVSQGNSQEFSEDQHTPENDSDDAGFGPSDSYEDEPRPAGRNSGRRTRTRRISRSEGCPLEDFISSDNAIFSSSQYSEEESAANLERQPSGNFSDSASMVSEPEYAPMLSLQLTSHDDSTTAGSPIKVSTPRARRSKSKQKLADLAPEPILSQCWEVIAEEDLPFDDTQLRALILGRWGSGGKVEMGLFGEELFRYFGAIADAGEPFNYPMLFKTTLNLLAEERGSIVGSENESAALAFFAHEHKFFAMLVRDKGHCMYGEFIEELRAHVTQTLDWLIAFLFPRMFEFYKVCCESDIGDMAAQVAVTNIIQMRHVLDSKIGNFVLGHLMEAVDCELGNLLLGDTELRTMAQIDRVRSSLEQLGVFLPLMIPRFQEGLNMVHFYQTIIEKSIPFEEYGPDLPPSYICAIIFEAKRKGLVPLEISDERLLNFAEYTKVDLMNLSKQGRLRADVSQVVIPESLWD